MNRLYIKLFCLAYFLGLFGLYSNITLGSFSLASVVFPVLYLISVLLFFSLKFTTFKLNFCIWVISLLFGIIISSVFSYDPILSLQSVFVLFFNFLFVYILVTFLSKNETLGLILLSLKIMTFIGVIFFFIYNPYVLYIDPIERPNILGFFNYKGMFTHKITAGIYNVVGVILSYHYYISNHSKSNFLWMIFFSFFVIISGSSLGIFGLILSFFYFYFFNYFVRIFNWKYVVLSLSFISIIFLFWNLFSLTPVIFRLLGRDENLTGRTFIWRFGFDYILENPLLGSGYSLFFNTENMLAPAQMLWKDMVYYSAPSFHNGFIQLVAETGILGSFVILFSILFSFYRLFIGRNRPFSSIFVLCIIVNFGSSLLINPNSFFFVFIFYSFFLFVPTRIRKMSDKSYMYKSLP